MATTTPGRRRRGRLPPFSPSLLGCPLGLKTVTGFVGGAALATSTARRSTRGAAKTLATATMRSEKMKRTILMVDVDQGLGCWRWRW